MTENYPFETPKYTVDINNILPIPESKKNTELFIPNFKFGPTGSKFDEQAILESIRVASLVLKYLKVDENEKFKSFHHPFDLVDVNASVNGLKTFPRTDLGKKNMDLPIIVFSEAPVYDSHGNREMAIYSPENALIFISFDKLENQFSEDVVEAITKPGDIVLKKEVVENQSLMAGIAMIEEIIHFVQMSYWGEVSIEGSSGTMSIEEHDSSHLESEARAIKTQLIKLIYPELVLREIT